MQLLIFLFLSWLLPVQSSPADDSQISREDQAEYRIALSNVSNPSFTPTEEQLEIALKSGVSLFEITPISDISHYTEKNFSVLFHADIPYPTAKILRENRHRIIQKVTDNFLSLSNRQQSYIAAVGLFRYPADFSHGFGVIASSIADSILTVINKPLYYHTFNKEINTPRGFSFTADHVYTKTGPGDLGSISSPVVYLEPSENIRGTLIHLKELMDSTRNLNESVIILPADWFFHIYNSYPAVSSVMKKYTEGQFITMPLPGDTREKKGANPPIIILFLTFAGLIIQYKYQPVVLQFVGRYFFNHSFFMADILDYRIRMVSPGLIFAGFHSVVNGLFFMSLFQTFFSEEGLYILSYHFSAEFTHGSELINIFIAATVIGLAIHLISILWLRLLNRQINSFSKALNLYIWPFMFTLILTAILVFNLYTAASELLAIVVSILYLLTWLISFASASINAARRLEKYRTLILFFTVGLYSLIFAGLCASVVMVPSIFEPLHLALNVP